jgi:undecaprenyl-diphosphatase
VSVALHLGTLGSVLVFFWRAIVQLLTTHRRAIGLVLVGTIPAATFGIALKEFYGEVLESPLVAGCMFPVTALLLWWGSRQAHGTTHYSQLSYPRAVIVGCLQAFAILPGVSRSGSTIAGGLSVGLDRQSAGTFAFLLAIPAIGGAGFLELLELLTASDVPQAAETSWQLLLMGGLVSFVVGFGALWLLVRWIERGKLAMFIWYLVPLGIAVVAWQLGSGGV